MTDPAKIAAAVQIAFGLVNAGVEMYQTLQNKESLSDDDLLALIAKENTEQAKARQALLDLMEKEPS